MLAQGETASQMKRLSLGNQPPLKGLSSELGEVSAFFVWNMQYLQRYQNSFFGWRKKTIKVKNYDSSQDQVTRGLVPREGEQARGQVQRKNMLSQWVLWKIKSEFSSDLLNWAPCAWWVSSSKFSYPDILKFQWNMYRYCFHCKEIFF